jgi:hypothetical protein
MACAGRLERKEGFEQALWLPRTEGLLVTEVPIAGGPSIVVVVVVVVVVRVDSSNK